MTNGSAPDNWTKDWRWTAVEARNGRFDGIFYFAVRTTGVYCRPSCTSRSPRRENVAFFERAEDAEHAGFRSCLRCRPREHNFAGPGKELVTRALRVLTDRTGEIATVDSLAHELGVTTGHLQKTFRSMLGLTPKEVLDMTRIESFKENVRESDVTTSLYESGFGSSRSLYEKAGEKLGMTPGGYKKGGLGEKISYTVTDSPLGKMLVAATARGICSVSFADDEASLVSELQAEFFAADISDDPLGLREAVQAILKGLEGERTIFTLPLDLRGTAFQMRVWSELRKIPYGEIRSYAEVAESIGKPKGVRAVARACATNPVAIVTPCHRVVASDGKLSGYKWGIERKKEILEREGAK